MAMMVDPQNIEKNMEIQNFLEEAQTIHIGEKFKIGPKIQYWLIIVAFTIPTAWSLWSLYGGNEIPPRLYYDGCHDPKDLFTKYNLTDCFICCNDRGFVYKHLLKMPKSADEARSTALLYTLVVGVLSIPMFAKLVMQETIALFLIPFGIIVKSKFAFSQLWPVALFSVLFIIVAVLNINAAAKRALFFDTQAWLGFGDICNSASYMKGKKLVADFDTTNPSLSGAGIPESGISYVTIFVAIFAPFVPILIKFYVQCSTTFSKLGLEHLMKDNERSALLFEIFKYEVDEDDLMKAIETYAKDFGAVAKSPGALLSHCMTGSCSWDHPLPQNFGNSWGQSESDVKRVCFLLANEGKLLPYMTRTKGGSSSSPQGGAGGGGGGAGGAGGKPVWGGIKKNANQASFVPPPGSPMNMQGQQPMMMMGQQQPMQQPQMMMRGTPTNMAPPGGGQQQFGSPYGGGNNVTMQPNPGMQGPGNNFQFQPYQQQQPGQQQGFKSAYM